MTKEAVLIMAYGSPAAQEDIEPYYTDIRRGSKPTAEQLAELTSRYEAIGGGSPLLKITSNVAKQLQQSLGLPVYMGMRHWKPWIKEAVAEMKKDGIQKAVAIIMAPHYSGMSIARYIAQVEEALKSCEADIAFNYIKSWHNEPLFIEALEEKILKANNLFNSDEEPHVIFTAHSLPEKILTENDPYKEQLIETCILVAHKTGIKSWSFAFQSAGRTEDKWLGPDLIEEIDRLNKAGVKSILVCSVGFIADHLEVLYDIDIEAKKHAIKIGIHLERTESLNAHPLLIQLFKNLAERQFQDLSEKI